MKSPYCFAVAASLATLLLAGCRVVEHKDGKKDNVAISTPFGSMQVKTGQSGDTSSIGLTAYPGATPVKDGHNSHDSADVNLNFGDFHLGVKAASFQTSDSTDKVVEFYRQDMARYGEVIECKDDKPVGTPVRTSHGLTCDKKNKNDIHTGDWHGSRDEIELRAGSEEKQHIVGIEQKDGGTRIGLVMLNLPSGLGSHSSKDAE